MIAAEFLWPPISATKLPPRFSALRTPASAAVRFPASSDLHPLHLAGLGLLGDLRQGRARRDHLRIHLELDDRRIFAGGRLLEGRRELLRPRDRGAKYAIGPGEAEKIR